MQTKTPEMAWELSVVALERSKEIDYTMGIAESYFSIGLSFWYRDLYDQAIENYYEALKIYETLGLKDKVARVKMNLGNNYDELGETEKAKQFIKEALAVFEDIGDTAKILSGYLNLGVVHFYEEEYDSALKNFEVVRDFRIARKDTSELALIYLNIANVYEFMQDMPNAVVNYRKANTLVDPNDLLAVNTELGLGSALMLSGSGEEGERMLKSGLEKAKKSEQRKMEQYAYEQLKEYYSSVGRFKEALDNQELEIALEREWRGEEVLEQVRVLELKYEDEKKARELASVRAERAKERLYLTIAVAIGSALLITSILLVIIIRLRVKNARLKEGELRQELAAKNKELTSYALNFIQKNELLNELSEKVNTLKVEAPEKTSKELNQLSNVIKGHMRIDQEWDNFKLMFEEVHQGFLLRLKDAYPELGNSELKLCALLRLNMNLKESSQILGIASDSVKTARSRLRKKLGLSTEENLVDFMMKFDSNREQKMSA